MAEDRAFVLTEAELEKIAERAAQIALNNVYTSIGKSVVSKFFIVVGIGTVALMTYLNAKGFFK